MFLRSLWSVNPYANGTRTDFRLRSGFDLNVIGSLGIRAELASRSMRNFDFRMQNERQDTVLFLERERVQKAALTSVREEFEIQAQLQHQRFLQQAGRLDYAKFKDVLEEIRENYWERRNRMFFDRDLHVFLHGLPTEICTALTLDKLNS